MNMVSFANTLLKGPEMSTQDYENWIWPFGVHKGKLIAEIPDTYLDWIIGQDWFAKQPRNREWMGAIGLELAARKRSHYSVRDQFDRGMEDEG